jgi:2-keto-4-pentenoate hydratase
MDFLELSQFDPSLEAGMRIMTGSFVQLFHVRAGDRIEAWFDPVGIVTADFVE